MREKDERWGNQGRRRRLSSKGGELTALGTPIDEREKSMDEFVDGGRLNYVIGDGCGYKEKRAGVFGLRPNGLKARGGKGKAGCPGAEEEEGRSCYSSGHRKIWVLGSDLSTTMKNRREEEVSTFQNP
ncbi:unnamed protein product [Malus baccata var. baccata]